MDLREVLKEEKRGSSEKDINLGLFEFIVFTIQDQWFAIELSSIIEIGEIRNYISFPIAPNYIKGFQFVHGNAVILFDVLGVLTTKGAFVSGNIDGYTIIILKYKEDYFGIIINDLIETVSVLKEKILSVPEGKEYYKGTFKYKDKTVSILNIEQIIESTYNLKK